METIDLTDAVETPEGESSRRVVIYKASRARGRLKAMAVNPEVTEVVKGGLWQVRGSKRPYLVSRVRSGERSWLVCDDECPAAQGGLYCYHMGAVELFEEGYEA